MRFPNTWVAFSFFAERSKNIKIQVKYKHIKSLSYVVE